MNPGLWLLNMGMDFDVTPRLRFVNNANYMWFDKTASLETFTFQDQIARDIGLDLSTGFEFRPRFYYLGDGIEGGSPFGALASFDPGERAGQPQARTTN